ncbi:MAG: carbonic anhydrase [Hyphomicrobiaceae bacterium]
MSYFPDHLADRYRRFKLRHFVPHQNEYERLANQGQHPEVMVVSCCDSRVEPEAVSSAMPGELFVVRNVANLVPPYETDGKYHGVSAALEFAALNLRVKHIVVIGHSGCGGVRACIDHEAARQTEAEFIANWMSMLDGARVRLVAANAGRPASELSASFEREGIKVSLANLRTFPCVQALEGRGRLALHGAYFDISTGQLSVLNEATNSFAPL